MIQSITLRRLLLPLLLACAAVFSVGCTDTSSQAARAAADLQAAWPDTIALSQCAQRYDSIVEELAWPWLQYAFARDFLDQPALQSDTLAIAASLLAPSADEFADEQSQAVIDGLLTDSISNTVAADRIIMVELLAPMLGREGHIDALHIALEEAAASLPLREQMLLYSKAASPARLGHALADDLEQGDNVQLTRERA